MGITDPAQEYFKDGGWSWNGAEWVKNSPPFSVSARWAEDLGGTKVGAGTYSKYSVAVPSGYFYVAQFMFFRNTSGTRSSSYLSLYAGATRYILSFVFAPDRHIPDIWNGGVVLQQGDRVRITQSGCLDGDNIEAGVWGYLMKVT